MNTQPGTNGLPKLLIDTPRVRGEIYLHGAHITHYERKGEEPILFLSKSSFFDNSKPIRGGVPICFPWFGPRGPKQDSPMHGFARLMDWKVESSRNLPNDEAEVVLSLRSNDATRTYWPEDFTARFTVRFGAELVMSLQVTNTSNRAFQYEEALHTYFAVSDIRKVQLTGLAGAEFTTKVQGQQGGRQGDAPITFTAETDRVYHNAASTCVIHDPGLSRKITVAKGNSNTTVVWNPWIDRAKALADLGDDEWTGMLCVESANAFESAVKLEPGKSHTLVTTIR